MAETVRIASFTAAHPSPKDSSKTVPAKFKDEAGRDFAIARDIVDFVEEHQGQMVEIEFQSTINGKYTNRLLTAAKLAAHQPASNGSVSGSSKSPEEAARICRQNALTNAVGYYALFPDSAKPTEADVLGTARVFAAWNLDGVVTTRDGGPKAQLAKVGPDDNDDTPPPWVGLAS